MAIPVEEAIAALSTFSLEDEQPDVQGLAVLLSSERYATNSPIEYSDVAAYRLSLGEDTKAINQLNTLIQEGKEMASLLYTYRSCVKALPQLPDSMKHSQADLYLEHVRPAQILARPSSSTQARLGRPGLHLHRTSSKHPTPRHERTKSGHHPPLATAAPTPRMPPPPLPLVLHRVFSLLPRLASPRHLLQAHAFLLPRGGHRHPRLLSALLLASLRLPLRAHAIALLRRLHPSVSLNAAARIPHLRGTLCPQLHSLVVRSGLASDAHVSASLIQTYCSCGRVTYARSVFDETINRDVFCWNVMISGYVKSGELACARELFDVMPERNVVSWTTVIGAYAQMRRPEEAVEVFRRMQVEEGIGPDGVALLSVLSACGDLGAVDLGEWVHRFVVKEGLCRQIPLMNAIIDMYVKCGCVGKAVEVFEGMEQKSVVTWTTVIAGFALHGLGLEAVEMFHQMERENVVPNDVTFLAILSACTHVGLTDLGRWYFNIMVSQYRIKPRVEHYGCMVDLLGRAGCLMEAQDLVQDMPFKANAAIWGALLAAARTHGDAELGEQALLHLIELEPHNSGNYILLSNIYAEQEMWDDVSKLRKAMKDRCLRNVPGASSIEVDGMVHEFTSRDGSHPCLYEICKLLCEITADMKSIGYVTMLPELLHDIEEG